MSDDWTELAGIKSLAGSLRETAAERDRWKARAENLATALRLMDEYLQRVCTPDKAWGYEESMLHKQAVPQRFIIFRAG